MEKFFKGSLFLIGAAFLGECLEFFTNMILARELGETGLGLYMSILPVIFLIMLLSNLELPTSISKYIAEEDEKYHRSLLKKVFTFMIIYCSILIPLTFLILPILSIFDHYHPFFKYLITAFIPISAFTAIIRGFLIGKEKMGIIAISSFLKKGIQLLLLVLFFSLAKVSLDVSVLLAFLTFFLTECVLFIYFITLFLIQLRTYRTKEKEEVTLEETKRKLIAVSGPATTLRVFHALTHAVEPFLIKTALVAAGFTMVVANEKFGALAGITFTIGFFPAFIAHSFMIVIIPTVSKWYARFNLDSISDLLRKICKITLAYGSIAIIIMFVFGEWIAETYFHSQEAGVYLKLLWPMFLLNYFIMPMQAFMIALGLVKETLYHFLWGTLVSFVLMFFLGSRPEFGMGGIIIALNFNSLLVFLLHYLTLCKKLNRTIFLKKIY